MKWLLAGRNYKPNDRYVLEGSGADGCHLDCGPVLAHDAATAFSAGWCHVVVACPTGGTGGYILSMGYGGAHPGILLGLSGDPVTGYAVTGNTYDGSTSQSFSGTYRVKLGEWVHIMVRWVTSGTPRLEVYVNGLPDYCVRWAGPTKTTGNLSDAHFYLFGSGHINFQGRLALAEGWWNAEAFASTPELVFVPERQAGAFGGSAGKTPCHYLYDILSARGVQVHDDSPCGWESYTGGGAVWHPARLCGAGSDGGSAAGFFSPKPSFNGIEHPFAAAPPQWVKDLACPYGTPVGAVSLPGNRPTPTALSTFAGCVNFDRGDKDNSCFWNVVSPGLGSCEAGSSPAQAWVQSHSPGFGVHGGLFRYLGAGSTRAMAFLDSGKAAHDVRVTCVPFGERTHCNIFFRGKDHDNYYYLGVSTNISVPGDYITWGKRVAGVDTAIGSSFNGFPAGSVTGLRAVCDPDGTTIRIYKNVNTLVATLTSQTDLATETKYGLLADTVNGGNETNYYAAKDINVR